jgi:hypothetical protein
MSFRSFPYAFITGGTKIINQQDGTPTTNFYKYLLALFNRTGAGTGIVPIVSGPLTAAGGSQADALALANDWNNVTAAFAGSGVVMPQMSPGNDISVLNNSGTPINVYPFPGASINAASQNSPYSLAPGDLALFEVWSTTQIYLVRLTTGL